MANVKISALTAGTALSGSELFECVQSGSSVKVTTTQIRTAVTQQNIQKETVAGGFTVSFGATTDVLLLLAGGGVSGGTIDLPSTPLQGQTAHISSSQNMTSLTFAASGGATIVGAPTSVTNTTPCAFVYDGSTTSWYRIV